ncbi:class I histocompatibility antigen, F10 alpha chain-like isoform X3 [Anomaloglossus baeobatrachus]|uniref:class I histocompatibility antigen, F10 alpha chain-like isoform X3 n=1 Tax=Anomaloglossus baeobatrachus TaxID=238106 RepID=UPI003F4FD6D5
MYAVTMILMSVSGAYSDSHSLRYYCTGISSSLPGIPEFSIIGYLDDQLTELYSSDIKKRIPVAEWLKAYNDPEYWERTTQVCKGDEALFKQEVKIGMKRFNHSGVRPHVKVTGRETGGIMKLHCQVYGFHPRAVDVRWMNGEDEVPSYETTNVLPNPDGTYQIRVSAEVTPKEGDRYSCYVDHSSLKEPLLVQWEPPQNPHLAVVITVVSIVLILTSVIAGVIIIYKKKKNYTAADTSDTSSDT